MIKSTQSSPFFCRCLLLPVSCACCWTWEQWYLSLERWGTRGFAAAPSWTLHSEGTVRCARLPGTASVSCLAPWHPLASLDLWRSLPLQAVSRSEWSIGWSTTPRRRRRTKAETDCSGSSAREIMGQVKTSIPVFIATFTWTWVTDQGLVRAKGHERSIKPVLFSSFLYGEFYLDAVQLLR